MFIVAAVLAADIAVSTAARIEAARAIERARYTFVLGATVPFDEAYPRGVFAQRVARERAEEPVLERVFDLRVRPALLAAEFERIEKDTRAPEQWQAIKAALGHDRRLIEEAFCRPLVVRRALQARFAFDRGLHSARHAEARQAREVLRAGGAPAGMYAVTLARRGEGVPTTDTLLERAKAGAGPRVLAPPAEVDEASPLPIEPQTRTVLEAQLRRPGDVSTILEHADRFDVYRLVASTPEAWQVEAVRVRKREFGRWLEEQRER